MPSTHPVDREVVDATLDRTVYRRPEGDLRDLRDIRARDIIAVLQNDNMMGAARDVSDVPPVLIERLQHYFLTYKLVPGQRPVARIKKAYGRDHAVKVVKAAMADYASAFLGMEE